MSGSNIKIRKDLGERELIVLMASLMSLQAFGIHAACAWPDGR